MAEKDKLINLGQQINQVRGEYNLGFCDKCNQEVPLENDAVSLDLLQGRVAKQLAIFHPRSSRHLMPIEGEGTKVCEGSPSRVKAINATRESRESIKQEFYWRKADEAYNLMGKIAKALRNAD